MKCWRFDGFAGKTEIWSEGFVELVDGGPTRFNPNNFLLILLQISLLFMRTPRLKTFGKLLKNFPWGQTYMDHFRLGFYFCLRPFVEVWWFFR